MASPRRRHCRSIPVREPGDDVFDAGPDPAVHPVVVVADDPRPVWSRRGEVIEVMARYPPSPSTI